MDSFFTESSEQLARTILRAGYPSFPGIVLATLCLVVLLGLPGARPHDDKHSHHVLVWRLRIAALSLALIGVSCLVCYRILAYRLLTEDAAAAMMDDLIWRWSLPYAIAVGLAIAARLWLVRHGYPWISARLRKLRVTQSTEKLADIRTEMSRWQDKDFDPRKFYKAGLVFTGLQAETHEPVYLTLEDYVTAHKAVALHERAAEHLESLLREPERGGLSMNFGCDARPKVAPSMPPWRS